MHTWIALLRGINVGGNNILPMAKLREDLESLNFENVVTYIQSGNVLFQTKEKDRTKLAKKIGTKIFASHGFEPSLLLLTMEELESAIENNPYPDATADPKSLHFFSLASEPTSAQWDRLEKAKSATESYQISGQVFYLHAPDGIGRSKLAASAEKLLGVSTTARNFQTVNKLSTLGS
jgi:uncharacterized protein (DUF1697 family)